MAGIYVHIPFCKRRCIYCDFFSTTHLAMRDEYVRAVIREAWDRRECLGGEQVGTIYLGGGTPSQLEPRQIREILSALKEAYDVSPDAEITMEANPDDVEDGYPSLLLSMGINRISMGVQSFDDGMLSFLGRRHDASKAVSAVSACQREGLLNISIDLMYGLPGQSRESWERDLDKALSLGVCHLSAYHLIYEEGTRMSALLSQGKISPADEELSLAMFEMLISKTREAGLEHYEISNFAKKGFRSRHNSSYWEGVPYLGLGAAAHSFTGDERQWNISSLGGYIEGILSGNRQYEKETLDERTRYNEMIMTGLRTSRGVSRERILRTFPPEISACFEKEAARKIAEGLLEEDGGYIRLSHRGIFISDGIMSDLMVV